ncbi:MAG TPA: universal stress protein, partial [Longimicrobiaceae bacterium]|nr:universal stress protein [Longimicrobiaceae bacterium]
MRAPIRKLVAGVATLRPNDPVLTAALQLSARLGAELDLVHVQGPDARAGASAPLGFRGVLRRLVEAAEPSATASGRVTCRMRTGSAAYGLLEAAGPDADLLVLGATRRDPLAGAILGTTAGRVLRAARVPVLVLRGELPDRPLRVLLTTDLSSHSAYAHSRGAALARALGAPAEAELRTLFVEPPPLLDGVPARPLVHAGSSEELDHFLGAEVPQSRSLPLVRSGDAAAEIEREAREWGA